jgi:hypothetical protein
VGGAIELGEFDGGLGSIVIAVCDVVSTGANEDALDIEGMASTGDHVLVFVDEGTVDDVVSKGVDEGGSNNWPNGDTDSIGDPKGTDDWPIGDDFGLSDGTLDA